MPPILAQLLDLDECPHCHVDHPDLVRVGKFFNSSSYDGGNSWGWSTYRCQRCGGVVLARGGTEEASGVDTWYPSGEQVSADIPEAAANRLRQAIASMHSAPAGSVMLAAGAVDAMLKAKGYTEGDLYPRINQAKDDCLITSDMADWAHDVRLDANAERHVDEGANEPTFNDANRCVDFALALAELLFVLPQRVTRGRAEAAGEEAAGAQRV